MAGFPISGWGATAPYVRKYPRTLAAFQEAMGKAQRLAATDRSLVEQVLPACTSIKPKLAPVIALGAYPLTLSASQLQRVADVMLQYGFLHRKLTVSPMILPSSQ